MLQKIANSTLILILIHSGWAFAQANPGEEMYQSDSRYRSHMALAEQMKTLELEGDKKYDEYLERLTFEMKNTTAPNAAGLDIMADAILSELTAKELEEAINQLNRIHSKFTDLKAKTAQLEATRLKSRVPLSGELKDLRDRVELERERLDRLERQLLSDLSALDIK